MLKKTLNEGTQFFKGPGKLTKSANIMDTPFARSLGRRDSALFRRFSEGSSTDLKQAQLYEVVDPHNSLPPPSGGRTRFFNGAGYSIFLDCIRFKYCWPFLRYFESFKLFRSKKIILCSGSNFAYFAYF